MVCVHIYRLSSIETRNHISKNCVTIQNEEYTYEKTENSKYMHFCALFVLEWYFLLIENYQLVKFYDNQVQCYNLVPSEVPLIYKWDRRSLLARVYNK